VLSGADEKINGTMRAPAFAHMLALDTRLSDRHACPDDSFRRALAATRSGMSKPLLNQL
jgi:hypothetical protein